VKFFRDQLPFQDVPIKLFLRAKKRGEEPIPAGDDTVLESKARAKGEKRSTGPDLSGLSFKTDVNEEEFDRDAKKVYDADLWRNL